MQKKTSSKEFLKYGNVYDAPIDAERNNMTSTRQKTVSASFIVLTVLYILKCSPVCRAS